jgi:hypothetical protein
MSNTTNIPITDTDLPDSDESHWIAGHDLPTNPLPRFPCDTKLVNEPPPDNNGAALIDQRFDWLVAFNPDWSVLADVGKHGP